MKLVGNLIGYALAVAFMLILLAIAVAIPAVVGFAIYKAFPRKGIEPRAGEGWLDTIFANQYVIFSARVVLIALALVLLFGAIYVSFSIFYRIWRREFLHKVGWFEAAVGARADRELEQFGEVYQEMLDEAWKQNEELAQRLDDALDELQRVTDERDDLAGKVIARRLVDEAREPPAEGRSDATPGT